ncbi:MAG: RidA family protein [Pseudomonadota bacterium]
MTVTPIDAEDAPASRAYAQGILVSGIDALMFVSGQIPINMADEAPDGVEAQVNLVVDNLEAQLRAGGLGLGDVVKLTALIASSDVGRDALPILAARFGGRIPAITAIVCEQFNPSWLLEVEAIAVQRAAQ